MKKVLIFLLAILLVIPFSSAYIGTPGVDFVPNQLIVKFKPAANIQNSDQAKIFAQGLSPETISKSERAFPVIKKINTVGLDRIYVIDFNPHVDIEKIITAYNKSPNIEYVEPNWYGESQAVPNDPNYANTFPINQSGLRSITPERGWDYTTGNSNIIIANVDLGLANLEVNTTHPEFQNNLYININEIQNDGIDNDANNCTDDYYGCDITQDSGKNLSDISSASHGTRISGILSALTNNNLGIAGTCWNCKIMVVRIASCPNGGCPIPSLNLSKGIIYAVNNDAKIISISTAYKSSDPNLSSLYDSTLYADQKNVIIAAVAGNQNNVNPNIYPGSYDTVLGIAGIFDNGTKWITSSTLGSNYGFWVDASAPSYKIISTLRNGSVGLPISISAQSGTSFAAPFVAGEAGLILSRWPGLLKKQVEYIIKDAVDNINASNPAEFQGQLGTGRINLTKAMEFGCLDKTFLRSCSITKPYYCDFDSSNLPVLSINISMCGWCQDTDGGINETITGNTTYFDLAGIQVTTQDNCQNKNTLTEYYCASNQSTSTSINCGSGRQCNAGSCVIVPPSGGSPFIFKKVKVTEIFNSPEQVFGFLVPISRFLRFIIPAL